MKNQKLYEETVDVLAKAYINNTLVHGNCAACAIGNMIAARNGYSCEGIWKTQHGVIVSISWSNVFMTISNRGYKLDGVVRADEKFAQVLGKTDPEGIKELMSLDYSIRQSMDIEWAFEIASKEGDWELNGLLAIVDVLDIIHENVDVAITAETKKKFTEVKSCL